MQMNELKDRINQRMTELNLTEQQVSERMSGKPSQVTIHKLRTGKQKRTTYIHELAEALECDSHWLLDGTINAKGGSLFRIDQKISEPGYDFEIRDGNNITGIEVKHRGALKKLHDLAPKAVDNYWIDENDAKILVEMLNRLIDKNKPNKRKSD